MAHHSMGEMDPGLLKRFFGDQGDEDNAKKAEEALLKLRAKMGATGEFPQGQLSACDEGEIRFGVGSEAGKVIINFGSKPVSWMGMDPKQAHGLARILTEHARRASRLQDAAKTEGDDE